MIRTKLNVSHVASGWKESAFYSSSAEKKYMVIIIHSADSYQRKTD